jgi:hypothetical protein
MEPSYSLDQKTVQLRAYSMQKAKVKAIARTSYSNHQGYTVEATII